MSRQVLRLTTANDLYVPKFSYWGGREVFRVVITIRLSTLQNEPSWFCRTARLTNSCRHIGSLYARMPTSPELFQAISTSEQSQIPWQSRNIVSITQRKKQACDWCEVFQREMHAIFNFTLVSLEASMSLRVSSLRQFHTRFSCVDTSVLLCVLHDNYISLTSLRILFLSKTPFLNTDTQVFTGR